MADDYNDNDDDDDGDDDEDKFALPGLGLELGR